MHTFYVEDELGVEICQLYGEHLPRVGEEIMFPSSIPYTKGVVKNVYYEIGDPDEDSAMSCNPTLTVTLHL